MSKCHRHRQKWETINDAQSVSHTVPTHTYPNWLHHPLFLCHSPSPDPHPTLLQSPHMSLCGQWGSYDLRNDVRSSGQREFDHPNPNAIQIKECIQQKGGHPASPQKGPYDGGSDEDSPIINLAYMQAKWRVKFRGTVTSFYVRPLELLHCNGSNVSQSTNSSDPLSHFLFLSVFMLLTALVNILFSL